MSFDLSALRAAVARHGSVTRVVIAAHTGSSPREAGAAMLVWAEGAADGGHGASTGLVSSDAIGATEGPGMRGVRDSHGPAGRSGIADGDDLSDSGLRSVEGGPTGDRGVWATPGGLGHVGPQRAGGTPCTAQAERGAPAERGGKAGDGGQAGDDGQSLRGARPQRFGQSGTIGGGALEYAACARALALPGRSLVERVPLGPALGQCCGGAVTLVYERFTADTLPPEGESYARPVESGAGFGTGPGEHPASAANRGESGASCHSTPDLGTPNLGANGPDGPPRDALASLNVPPSASARPAPLAVRKALAGLRAGNNAIGPVLTQGWLIEAMDRPARALWIWGAGHVGRALVGVLSPLPDFAITWVDTSPDRFPAKVPEGVTVVPAAAPARLVAHAPRDAAHLIMTFSHALDLSLCHELLGHGFQSAGLIGSASKWVRFQKRLRALGHGDAAIGRIECPIGDPQLGKHPQAIAIGVAQVLLMQARADARARMRA